MRLVLRHAQSGLYYGGPRRWVGDPELALDLGTIEDAVKASRRPEFVGIELVACLRYPDCDWVLSLRRPDPGYSEAVRSWRLRQGSALDPLPPLTPAAPLSPSPPRALS